MTDIEKAIEQLEMSIDCRDYYERVCSDFREYYILKQFPKSLFELALQALKEKAERENPKPLTLEELRERVGKPVWCEDSETWGFVVEDRQPIKECGKLYLKLYDHEPKGE